MLEEEKKHLKKPSSYKPYATSQSEAKKKQYQQAKLAQSQPVQQKAAQSSQNWYKGSQPTRSEALARIYTIGQTDENKARNLMSMFEEQEKDSSSPFYNPYTSATTSKNTQTNRNNTIKAQDEWARLSDELSYWATRTDRNYSDEEILNRINWDNYKTLQKMDEGRKTGNPLALLDAVGYSEDAMYGVMWAARNPDKGTGNAMYDAAQSVLGRGNQYKANDVSAYRDATDGKYSPYKAGATALDDLAYKYGMRGDFTREWLDGEGKALLNGDAQSREDYTRIYKVVTGTEAVEKEANAFYEKYAKPMIEAGIDPAKIFYDGVFEDLEYKNLAKFVEGGKSGDLYETAYAVGFDYDDLVKQANEYYIKNKGTISNTDYEQQLATSTGGNFFPDEGTEKSNEAKQLNTDILLPDYAPVATESERSAFRTTASAGYYDVVGATADFVQNGSGGEAEYKATAVAEANNYANEHLFGAMDDLGKAEEILKSAGMNKEEVDSFLETNFKDMLDNNEYPTSKDVTNAFKEGKLSFPEGMLPEEQTAYVKNVVNAVASRGQAADAQAVIDDVMDDLAEAYGEGTEQYNAAVATYKAAYDYSKKPKSVWTAFDNYQYASQQEDVTPEMLDYYLENQRGSVAREIRQTKALIENAEQMGIPADHIANMQKHLDDLTVQNELLDAHNLSKNKDYTAKVAEFDATYQAYQHKWFDFGANKLTQNDLIRYFIIDPESVMGLVDDHNTANLFLLAENMTDEERANYKYYFMTEGEDRANAYFSALQDNLYVRNAEALSESNQAFAEDHPLAGTAGSFIMVTMEPLAAASTIISKIAGEEINPYSPTFAATQAKTDLRTGAKEAFHNAVGEDKKALNWAFDTVYDAITSAADSGINAVIGGKYGSVLMGLSGFEAGVMDASMRGANDWQAIGYGIASAVIEGITEKAQIDQIFDSFASGSKAGKDALLKVLSKGFLSEAGEEMLSSLGGAISDELIMGELSNREAAIEKYMAETGLTREEAEKQANKDILTDILYSGLVGGLSGTISSGTSYGAGKIFGSDTETPSTQRQTKTTPVKTKKPDVSVTPSGNEMARAKAALNTSMKQGVSEAQQAATVSGVLQSYGMSDIEANAAAKRITDSGNTRLLNKMLSKTTNPELLMKAFAMGQVADNSACAAVLNKTINSKNIHLATNELLKAYASDTANGRVTANYDAKVASSAESDAVAARVAQTGAIDHTAVDNANAALKYANEQLGYARGEETAANQAVVNANAKFNQNPADPQAKAELKSAIDKQNAAQKKRSEAENRVNASTKKLETEKQALNAKAEEFMGIAREQVKPEVQQHTEQLNTQKAEQKAAAEVKRQNDNALAMEADDFVNRFYKNAPEDVKAKVRERYMKHQGKTQPVSTSMTRVANQFKKKFGLEIEFVDSHGLFKGAYVGKGKIVLDQNATQGDLIRTTLSHEVVHAVRKSNEWGLFSSAVLEVAYDGDTAKQKKDFEKLKEKYSSEAGQSKDDAIMEELVAKRFAEMIDKDPKSFERLASEKPSAAQRILDAIKEFLDKIRGVNDPEVEAIRKIEGVLEKALLSSNFSSAEQEAKFALFDKLWNTGDRKLVATHNISFDNLMRTIKLGGFPSPSTAVSRATLPEAAKHYADTTVFFGRDTVDPEADERNKLYSADSYTPRGIDKFRLQEDRVRTSIDGQKWNDLVSAIKKEWPDEFDSLFAEALPRDVAKEFPFAIHYLTRTKGDYSNDFDSFEKIKEKISKMPGAKIAALKEAGVEAQTVVPNKTIDELGAEKWYAELDANLKKATDDGRIVTEWINKKLEGSELPSVLISGKTKKEYPYTPEGIVEKMHEDKPKGNNINIEGQYHGDGFWNATKEYKAIEEARKDYNKLKDQYRFTTEEKEQRYAVADEAASARLLLSRESGDTSDKLHNLFYELMEGEHDYKTIKEGFEREGYHFKRSTIKTVQKVYQKLRDLQRLYAESKPDRVVGLNEMKTIITPEGNVQAIKAELAKAGVEGVEIIGYRDGDEADRDAKLHSASEQVKFSLPSDDILDEEIENYRAGIDTNWQDKQKESQFAKETGQNTNVLSPEAKKKLLDDPFYTTTSEKKNLALAVDKIAKEGYQRRRDMMLQGDTNLLTPEGQTEAYVLCKMAKESGDSDAEASLAFMVKESGTQLAQSLAMRNIYNRMSPDAQIKYVQKAVNKINAAYEAGGKDTRVAVPSWLPKAIAEANGDAKLINQHLDDAYREIAKSMPYSFKDWESTWRYLAMLGNPMTHAKNMLGTALYYPYIATRDKMSAAFQMFKPAEERTRAVGLIKKEYKDFAEIVAKTKKDALNGNSMSTTSNNALAKIEEYRQKGPKWMATLSDFNSDKLAKEDLFWKNIFFKKSLASYLQAHNADLNNLSPELLNAAVQHALNDAYKNTFNNTNQFAQWLSKMEKESAKMGRMGRIGAQAINTILPFKNTPANVLARGIDFSPVGLAKTLIFDTKKLKNGKITSSEYLDRLTMGITGGVGAVGLGFLLASLGVLHIEEDEMEDKQKNSIDILGQNIAIDWAGTAAMPILMGGKLYDSWQNTGKEMFGDGFDLSDIPDLMLMFGDAMREITDPMINLSVLQGVKNLVQTAGYAGDDMFSKLGTRVATTYASQFVPTFFGAVARIIDDTRRTTYTDKNIKGLDDVQYFAQSIENKLPFLSKNGMPYMDSWGNEESNGSIWRRLLNNLLLPGYSKSIESPDEVEKMLSDLYDTAVAKDFPEPGNVKLKAGAKSFNVNGKEYHMSADEYVKFSKSRGQTAYNLLHELMQTEDFYNGSDYYKYKSVENIWAYANATAKKTINSDYTSGTKWINATANPLESVMEQAATANKNHVNDEMKEDLYSAIVEGDEEDIFSITQMLLDNGVTKKSLKTSISNNMQQRYKNLYKEDSDDLLELEASLLMTGVITMGDINSWIIEE